MTPKWDGGLRCRTCGLRRLEVATTSSGCDVVTARCDNPLHLTRKMGVETPKRFNA